MLQQIWNMLEVLTHGLKYASMQEDENLENESNGSGSCDEEEDESSSGDDDDVDDEDGDENSRGDTFAKVFASLKPQVVSNLLKACRSHELFPLFEDHEVGSSEHQPNKCAFRDSPKEDLERWNSWLDAHGETWSACRVPVKYGPLDWFQQLAYLRKLLERLWKHRAKQLQMRPSPTRALLCSALIGVGSRRCWDE